MAEGNGSIQRADTIVSDAARAERDTEFAPDSSQDDENFTDEPRHFARMEVQVRSSWSADAAVDVHARVEPNRAAALVGL